MTLSTTIYLHKSNFYGQPETFTVNIVIRIDLRSLLDLGTFFRSSRNVTFKF